MADPRKRRTQDEYATTGMAKKHHRMRAESASHQNLDDFQGSLRHNSALKETWGHMSSSSHFRQNHNELLGHGRESIPGYELSSSELRSHVHLPTYGQRNAPEVRTMGKNLPNSRHSQKIDGDGRSGASYEWPAEGVTLSQAEAIQSDHASILEPLQQTGELSGTRHGYHAQEHIYPPSNASTRRAASVIQPIGQVGAGSPSVRDSPDSMDDPDTYSDDFRPENDLGIKFARYLRPKQLRVPIQSSKDLLWQHMKSLPQIEVDRMEQLPHIPGEVYIHAKLPRVRGIELNPRFRGSKKFNPKWGSNSLALVVYLTGEEAEIPCKSCANRSGPFVGCVLPHKSTHAHLSMISCANCRYNWQGKTCDHYVDIRRAPPTVMDENMRSQSRTDQSVPDQSIPDQSIPDQSIPDQAAAIGFPKTEQSRLEIFLDSLPECREVVDQARHSLMVKQEFKVEEDVANIPESEPNTEWEAAPGIWRTRNGNRQFAYSASYLKNNGREVPVHEGVGVRIVTINPSKTLRIQGNCLCFIHDGTLQLTVGDEQVNISSNGMFKVFAGNDVDVMNLSAVDVTMHVVALDWN
ncbi:putative Cupin 2 conserved barrel domain-containing protein [Seiridium cardinale]